MQRLESHDHDAPIAGEWWRTLAVLPAVELPWLVTSVVHVWYARAVGFAGQQYFGLATDGLVLLGLSLSVVAPFVLYHDRAWVAARSDWTPSLAYLLVVVPLVNAVVATLYLRGRRRAVGAPDRVTVRRHR